MKLLTDLWDHLKEWSDWSMKDWIKAGIVALIVIIIIGAISGMLIELISSKIDDNFSMPIFSGFIMQFLKDTL